MGRTVEPSVVLCVNFIQRPFSQRCVDFHNAKITNMKKQINKQLCTVWSRLRRCDSYNINLHILHGVSLIESFFEAVFKVLN